jgi:hypothetical protein
MNLQLHLRLPLHVISCSTAFFLLLSNAASWFNCYTLKYTLCVILQHKQALTYERLCVVDSSIVSACSLRCSLSCSSITTAVRCCHHNAYHSANEYHYFWYCMLLQVKRLSSDQYKATPSGDTFVNSTVRRGVLPVILDELLAARKVCTTAMIQTCLIHSSTSIVKYSDDN